MNQTLGFACSIQRIRHFKILFIDFSDKNAVNAMFTVLTSNVTAGELVQQEDANLFLVAGT